MKTHLKNPNVQKLSDDDFSIPEPTITDENSQSAKVDITQQDLTSMPSTPVVKQDPLVGEADEEIETKIPSNVSEEKKDEPKKEVKDKEDTSKKEADKPLDKPEKKENEEEKLDFVKTMRDNDLEFFTKELFTDNVSDEEFSKKLMSDKYFGEQTYVKEKDFTQLPYFPEELSQEIEELKQSISRNIANASPEQRKSLSKSKGVDEFIYNRYLSIAQSKLGEVASLGGTAGMLAAGGIAMTAGAPLTLGALAVGLASGASLALTGHMFTYGTLNSLERASMTSPEDIENLNNSDLHKSILSSEFSHSKIQDFLDEYLLRDEEDTYVEAHAKEFAHSLLDFSTFALGGKATVLGVKATVKSANAIKNFSVGDLFSRRGVKEMADSVEFSEVGEQLHNLVTIQQGIKEQGIIIKKAVATFDEIIENYEGMTGGIPVMNNTIDHNRIAGKAFDTYLKKLSKGVTDMESHSKFLYHSAKGSNHRLGTKLVAEMSKDESQKALAKLSHEAKFGKGAEGGGSMTMNYTEMIDELSRQRDFAMNKGDLILDSQLEALQSHLFDRVSIGLTKAGAELQEINRSMPFRKELKSLTDTKRDNLIALENKHIAKAERKRLEVEIRKADKKIQVLNKYMKDATPTELIAMGITNTVYSNMLAGTATVKAGLGGLSSTIINNLNLSASGISVSEIFKMQVNSLRQLVKDTRKFDYKEALSDSIHGTINNRFHSKNTHNLTIQPHDSLARKVLKQGNKAVNVVSAPIQFGLGSVDKMIDTFNGRQRAVEAWTEYVAKQRKAGVSSEDLIREFNEFIEDPRKMSDAFMDQVIRKTEENLALDKMMLNKKHSSNYFLSSVGWGIDSAFKGSTDNLIVNGITRFVNPFTRTAASALDSIAENTSLGILRKNPSGFALAPVTRRQMTGTFGALGLFYALKDTVAIAPITGEAEAGMMGYRTGLVIGGHHYPMSTLGVLGEAVEKFMVMVDSIEESRITEGVDASNVMPIIGALGEVLTANNMARNIKDFATKLTNIPDTLPKAEVTKLVESFMPAGWMLKLGADVTHGSLSANPLLAEVIGHVETEYGNTQRRDAFGDVFSKGELHEVEIGLPWLVNRAGKNVTGWKLKESLAKAGAIGNSKFASFRTEDGIVPYSKIRVDGNYTPFSAPMSPLSYSVNINGNDFKVSTATRNKGLSIVSMDMKTIEKTIANEITHLNYMSHSLPEARNLIATSKSNLLDIKRRMAFTKTELEKRGYTGTLSQILNKIMEKGSPDIYDEKFNEKRYKVTNLMQYNRQLFNGNLAKQKKFFERVNRVNDTVLLYNMVKNLGSRFMSSSAEVVGAEIKRIEDMKK